MMTYLIVIPFLLLSSISSATSFCFKNQSQRSAAKSKVADFLLPEESAQEVEENCLYFNLKNPQRADLIRHLLKPYSPHSSLKLESPKKRTCSFEVIETKISTENSSEARLPVKSKIKESHSEVESSQTMRLEGLEQRGISLGLDDNRLEITCFPRGKRAEVVLSYRSQSGPSVKTSLELAVGDEREIGSLIEDLKRDGMELGTEKGVTLSREVKKSQSRVLLKFLAIF